MTTSNTTEKSSLETPIRNSSRIQARLLSRSDAARYLGVGTTLFSGLVYSGIMPPGKALGAKRVAWDILELDRAIDELPEAATGLSRSTISDPYEDVRP